MDVIVGCIVVIDATHGIQQPASSGCTSGGDRRLAPVIARAALQLGSGSIYRGS